MQSDYYNMLLPGTINELVVFSQYVMADEPDFVEVTTKSALFADAKGAYSVFVLPGFQPNNLQNLYNSLGYPTFTARYPAKFKSITRVAEVLVIVRDRLLYCNTNNKKYR